MTELPDGIVPEWTLGDRLRRALRFAGVSPSEMADELGVVENTVGNYLAGRTTRIPKATLRVWALRCGVSYTWLTTGHGTGVDPSSPDSPGQGVRTKRTLRRQGGGERRVKGPDRRVNVAA